MKRNLCVATVLIAIWVPLYSLSAQLPADWTRPIEPFQIAENLYYVGSEDLTSFLITTDDGHILIDVPLEQNFDLVRTNIEKLGFDPADIEIQLASHGHFDHTGGVAPMMAITGAKLFLSEQDATLVANGGRQDFFLGDRASYPPATTDRILEHLDTVSLGGVTLTANLTPGHTRGCTSWSGTAQINGESFQWVSVCSLTVLNGYQLLGPDASYPGIARDFCTSVARLSDLQPDIFLASHGQFIGLTEKTAALANGDPLAFVDQDASSYRDYLEGALENLEETLSRQGETGGCKAILSADN